MFYISQFIISFICAIGFGLVFQTPKKPMIISGLNAGIGWLIYKSVTIKTGSAYMGTFLSAFVIAFISEYCAKIFRYPAVIFIVPGIINLCPGEAIFNTMKYFINNESTLVLLTLFKAMALAGAIAFGILLSTSFSTNMKNFRRRSTKRTNYTNYFRRKKWNKQYI